MEGENEEVDMETFYVDSLGEYLKTIAKIAKGEDALYPKLLWFRGVSHISHSLIPSLYRYAIFKDASRGGYTHAALRSKKLSFFSECTFIPGRVAGSDAASWCKDQSYGLV